jgi:hypothetical protein
VADVSVHDVIIYTVNVVLRFDAGPVVLRHGISALMKTLLLLGVCLLVLPALTRGQVLGDVVLYVSTASLLTPVTSSVASAPISNSRSREFGMGFAQPFAAHVHICYTLRCR